MAENTLTTEQKAVVENRGGPLLVSAAAGSGKTFVLVKRLLDRVENGDADIDGFLIITFTKAAAAELRGRILAELNRRLRENPGNSRLRRQAALIHRADIGTVDSFCSNLLRRWAWALDLSPDFRQMDEDESAALRERVIDSLLDDRYKDAQSDFLELADTVGTGRDDRSLTEAVLNLYRSTESLPEPEVWLAGQKAQALSAITALDPVETPWGNYFLRSRAEVLESRLEEMISAVALMADFPVIDEKYGPLFSDEITSGYALLSALESGWADASAAASAISFARLPTVKGESAKDRFKEVRDRYKSFCNELSGLLSAPAKNIMADLRLSARAVCPLLDLTADFCENFSREKLRRSLMDFADTERLALKLLEDPLIGGEIASRYTEVMVDEYQDINRLQERLFAALSSGGRKLFMVGDVKQSIYGFRLATPEVFLEKYITFASYKTAAPGQGRKIDLNLNFRSRGAVLEAVNHLCATVMTPRLGGLEYDKDQALYQGADFSGQDPPVEVVFIDTKADGPQSCDPNFSENASDGGEDEKAAAIEARYAAARIRRLIDTEGYAPSDIAILLRAMAGRAYLFEDALAQLNIPFVSSASGELFQKPEVGVLVSILEIIDNPTRDIPLAAALLSPVWGFSPSRLAEIRAKNRSASLAEALKADDGPDTAAFLEDLETLRAESRAMTADRLVWKLLTEKGLLFIYGPKGGKARENLLSLCAWAEKCRAQGHITLYAFLNQLRAAREKGRGTPASGDSGNAVKIMSMHKSKGLEFPVVLMCGLGSRFNRRSLDEQVLFDQELGVGVKLYDRQTLMRKNSLPRLAIREKLQRAGDSESLRILYVGMTRARERLILTAAPGSIDSVLSRAGRGFLPPNFGMLSGASSPAVWLAAAALTRPEGGVLLGEPPKNAENCAPLWHISLISPRDVSAVASPSSEDETLCAGDTPGGTDAETLTRNLLWRYPHQAATVTTSKATPSGLEDNGRPEERLPYHEAHGAQSEDDLREPKSRIQLPGFLAPSGLTAAEKGTALHMVMQYLNFENCTSAYAISNEIERLETQGFITPRQARAADPEKLLAFFNSDTGRRVLAGQPIREFKFSVLVDADRYFPAVEGEKILLQGMIDLYHRVPGGLAILDFKTDRIPPGGEAELGEKYRPQLEAYAAALEKITGEKVLEKTLYFFSSGKSFSL